LFSAPWFVAHSARGNQPKRELHTGENRAVILRDEDTQSPSKTLKAFQTALSSMRADSSNSPVHQVTTLWIAGFARAAVNCTFELRIGQRGKAHESETA